MTCQHEHAVIRYLATREAMIWKPWTNYAKVCFDCGVGLSLGPATDDERTAVELRAAEIAAELADRRRTQPQSKLADIACFAEELGWSTHRIGAATPRADREWSGWLAREIAEHDKEQAR